MYNIHYDSCCSVDDYINKSQCIVFDLNNIGDIVKEEDLAILLLPRLPKTYDNLIVTLAHGTFGNKLNTATVKAKLIQEENR